MAYDVIYSKKNNINFYVPHMEPTITELSLRDQDLMVDVRVGQPKLVQNLF